MTLDKSVYATAFSCAKSHVAILIKQLVPGWAQSMVTVTDAEIKQVSNPMADAIIASYLKSVSTNTAKTS